MNTLAVKSMTSSQVRPVLAPTILILNQSRNALAWNQAISVAASRYAWAGSVENRFLSNCLRPGLCSTPDLAESWTDFVAGATTVAQEDRCIDLALSLLVGAVPGSVYRPLPGDDTRVLAVIVPDDHPRTLLMGASRCSGRQLCVFWAGTHRFAPNSPGADTRPPWHPSLSLEESAVRVLGFIHTLGLVLGDIRYMGLAGLEGRIDAWA